MSDNVHDYHDFTTKSTPKEDRRRWNVGDLWINSVECLKCGDIIRSRNRRDFRWCSCESVAVDGGSAYQRVCGDIDNYKSIVEQFDEV